MKMIAAVIQPFMLTKLTRALEEVENFPGMTVMDVQGFGREKARHEAGQQHRRIEDVVDFTRKVRVEIVSGDAMVETILAIIVKTTHTGNRGDGKIFVLPVEHVVRIKTGEVGEAAI